MPSIDLLQQGIHLAIHFQKSLVEMGVAIIEKKLVTTLTGFQLAVLKGEGWGQQEAKDIVTVSFAKSPIHLTRLADFLMEAFMVSFDSIFFSIYLVFLYIIYSFYHYIGTS